MTNQQSLIFDSMVICPVLAVIQWVGEIESIQRREDLGFGLPYHATWSYFRLGLYI